MKKGLINCTRISMFENLTITEMFIGVRTKRIMFALPTYEKFQTVQLDFYAALGVLRNGDLCLMLVKKKTYFCFDKPFFSVLIEALND